VAANVTVPGVAVRPLIKAGANPMGRHRKARAPPLLGLGQLKPARIAKRELINRLMTLKSR
jgi:hypothetical protein